MRKLPARYISDLLRSVSLLNASDAMNLNMLSDEVDNAGLTANGDTWFGLLAIRKIGAPPGQTTLFALTDILYADDGIEANLAEKH